MSILQLEETEEEELIQKVSEAYDRIYSEQKIWYEKSGFTCPEGCGECCRNFEPDLLESEAVFMAAWLLENQSEVAEKVSQGEFLFPRKKGCQFWDEKAAYHCSVYDGRPFICRLFGASGAKDKRGNLVWKPCKFYPEEKLKLWKNKDGRTIPLAHHQYTKEEILQTFGLIPPLMSDLMEKAVAIKPEGQKTKLIRDILPETIRHLRLISDLNRVQTKITPNKKS